MINSIIIIIFTVMLLAAIVLIDDIVTTILICILSIVGLILATYNIDSNIPAIEVYRGNTELEITYKNDIPIDTVVVWKKDIIKVK
jgi:hypothetical protein